MGRRFDHARHCTAVIAVLSALFVLLSGSASAKVLMPRHASPDKYLEVVREKSPCPAQDCFVEYIVLTDGTAVRKNFPSDDYEKDAKIEIRRLDDAATSTLFDSFDSFFAEPRPPAKWTSNGGQVYYFAGGAPHSYSTPDINGETFGGLFGPVDAAFQAAAPAENFYVHGYYEVLGGETEDYHVFSNGQVIFSTFSRQSDRMLATAMMDYDPASLERLRALSKEAMGVTAAPYRKCPPETRLEYGLVEVQNGGKYIKSHTCADSDDGIANIFRYLRNMPAPAPAK